MTTSLLVIDRSREKCSLHPPATFKKFCLKNWMIRLTLSASAGGVGLLLSPLSFSWLFPFSVWFVGKVWLVGSDPDSCIWTFRTWKWESKMLKHLLTDDRALRPLQGQIGETFATMWCLLPLKVIVFSKWINCIHAFHFQSLCTSIKRKCHKCLGLATFSCFL